MPHPCKILCTTLPEAVASARARAGAAGWSDGPGRSFLLRNDRDRGRYASERVGACLCGGAGARNAGEDYTALAKTYPTPPRRPESSSDGDEGRLSEEAFPARFRWRPAGSEGEGPLCGPRAVPKALLTGKTTHAAWRSKPSFYAVSDGRPDDQSRSRTLQGQAHGRQDHRSEGESSVADIPPRRDHPVDPGSRRHGQLSRCASSCTGCSPMSCGEVRKTDLKLANRNEEGISYGQSIFHKSHGERRPSRFDPQRRRSASTSSSHCPGRLAEGAVRPIPNTSSPAGMAALL